MEELVDTANKTGRKRGKSGDGRFFVGKKNWLLSDNLYTPYSDIWQWHDPPPLHVANTLTLSHPQQSIVTPMSPFHINLGEGQCKSLLLSCAMDTIFQWHLQYWHWHWRANTECPVFYLHYFQEPWNWKHALKLMISFSWRWTCLLQSYLTFNMFAELVFPRELKCWLLLSPLSAAAGGLMCPVTHSHPHSIARKIANIFNFFHDDKFLPG